MRNLLTPWELRRKTDPKLEPLGKCFLVFLLEPLVGGWPCFRWVLQGQAIKGKTIVGRDIVSQAVASQTIVTQTIIGWAVKGTALMRKEGHYGL